MDRTGLDKYFSGAILYLVVRSSFISKIQNHPKGEMPCICTARPVVPRKPIRPLILISSLPLPPPSCSAPTPAPRDLRPHRQDRPMPHAGNDARYAHGNGDVTSVYVARLSAPTRLWDSHNRRRTLAHRTGRCKLAFDGLTQLAKLLRVVLGR